MDNQEEPVVNFTTLILQLATTAAMHFGDLADPETGTPLEPNVPAAAHIIELIAMLQQKTAGNLSQPEAKLIEDLLYELRMRFVQAQQGDTRIIIEP